MDICLVLRHIYGEGTKPTRVTNIVLSSIWLCMLILSKLGYVWLFVPPLILEGFRTATIIALFSIVFTVLSLLTEGHRARTFSFFGISLGAVLQGVLANGYVSVYPPLDMMLVLCFAIMVWFVGALLYIVKCEGYYGVVR